MNLLRQMSGCRNILKLSHRTNFLPVSVTSSHAIRTHERSHNINTNNAPISIENTIIRCLHNQSKLASSDVKSIGMLKQLQTNIDPYARLIRFDRPIGNVHFSLS